jgi:hypothetical protein
MGGTCRLIGILVVQVCLVVVVVLLISLSIFPCFHAFANAAAKSRIRHASPAIFLSISFKNRVLIVILYVTPVVH